MLLSLFVVSTLTLLEMVLREKFPAPVGAGGFAISTERRARISAKIARHHNIARARVAIEAIIVILTLALDLSSIV